MVTNLLESYCHQMPKITPRQLVHLSGLMTSTSPTVLPASPSTLQNATDAVFLSSVTISPNYNFSIPWTQGAHQDIECWVDQSKWKYTWSLMPQIKDGIFCRTTQERTWGGTVERPGSTSSHQYSGD